MASENIRLVMKPGNKNDVYYPRSETPALANQPLANAEPHAMQQMHRFECDMEIVDEVNGRTSILTLEDLNNS